MKRSFISLGLIVAATMTLTNCAKEVNPAQTPEPAGIPFEITASAVETKTSLEGLQTVWVDGDALNIFHAPAGTSEYVSDSKFTYSSENVFQGTLTSEPAGSTDWYAFYPHSDYIETPANTDAGYTYVWSKNGMTQDGNSNMSHLAGQNFPMSGKATVNAGDAVAVTMQHLTSVVKVVVTNTLDAELTVSNVSFTATEDVAGQYYIDFSGDDIVYTPRSGGDYVSNTASLKVSGADPLAKDGTAEFYIAMKPFKAPNGSKLYLNVNGTEKEITLENDVTFNAGQIKTLTFNYDTEVLPTEVSVEEFIDAEVSTSVWYKMTGVIKDIENTEYGNFYLEDETGRIYVYGLLTEKGGESKKFSTLGLKEGDVLTLVGQRGVHNDKDEVLNAYYVSHETSVAAPVISCLENTVTITAEDGATIYYTTDDSDPVFSATKQTYTAPFAIEETCTVKAYATASGKPQSVVAEQNCIYSSGEEVVVFYESFDQCTGTMGWSGNVAQGTFKPDNDGWVTQNPYGAGGAAKFGAGLKKGVATTPALGQAGDMTLTFKAGAWNGSSERTTLVLSIEGGGTLSAESVTLKKGEWSDYLVSITGATANTKITFAGKEASNSRFLLEDVEIVK